MLAGIGGNLSGIHKKKTARTVIAAIMHGKILVHYATLGTPVLDQCHDSQRLRHLVVNKTLAKMRQKFLLSQTFSQYMHFYTINNIIVIIFIQNEIHLCTLQFINAIFVSRSNINHLK